MAALAAATEVGSLAAAALAIFTVRPAASGRSLSGAQGRACKVGRHAMACVMQMLGLVFNSLATDARCMALLHDEMLVTMPSKRLVASFAGWRAPCCAPAVRPGPARTHLWHGGSRGGVCCSCTVLTAHVAWANEQEARPARWAPRCALPLRHSQCWRNTASACPTEAQGSQNSTQLLGLIDQLVFKAHTFGSHPKCEALKGSTPPEALFPRPHSMHARLTRP